MNRLYAGISLAAVLALFYWRYSYISGELDKERQRADKAESVATQMQLNQELENWARGEYLKELEIAKSEKERVEKCIADKSCVATIRVRVPAKCPSGAAQGDTTGTEDYAAELSADSARARARLESSIREWESKHRLCIQTLKNWETK